MKEVVTSNAPAAIGPYSQAIISGGFVFCSGQIALNASGDLVDGGVELQTDQVMKNLSAVLKAAGSSLGKVVKTTIYLADMNDFKAVNSVYENYFADDVRPARGTVEVSRLPKDVLVEIECIAEV